MDTALLERVRAALAGTASVTERRMFGSTGFLVRGNLCVSCRPERIMCRIDPALHEKLTRRSGCTTVVMRGREMRGYVYVSSQAVRTERSLRRWIDLALSHCVSLPSKKPKP